MGDKLEQNACCVNLKVGSEGEKREGCSQGKVEVEGKVLFLLWVGGFIFKNN